MTDILLNAAAAAEQSRALELKDWASVITAGVAVVALIVGPFTTWFTLTESRKNAERAAWQKTNESEATAIQERLDSFFGPFRTLSDVNRLMFRILRARTNNNLVLMRDLFSPTFKAALPAGEAALLAEVVANAKKLRDVIEENVGMVDEKVLPYLSRAAAHYRILELANLGELGTDPEPFKPFVFPASSEGVLTLEVDRLKRRRDWLIKHPYQAPPPLEPLTIPSNLKLPEWPNPTRTSTADLTKPLDPKG